MHPFIITHRPPTYDQRVFVCLRLPSFALIQLLTVPISRTPTSTLESTTHSAFSFFLPRRPSDLTPTRRPLPHSHVDLTLPPTRRRSPIPLAMYNVRYASQTTLSKQEEKRTWILWACGRVCEKRSGEIEAICRAPPNAIVIK